MYNITSVCFILTNYTCLNLTKKLKFHQNNLSRYRTFILLIVSFSKNVYVLLGFIKM